MHAFRRHFFAVFLAASVPCAVVVHAGCSNPVGTLGERCSSDRGWYRCADGLHCDLASYECEGIDVPPSCIHTGAGVCPEASEYFACDPDASPPSTCVPIDGAVRNYCCPIDGGQ